MNSFKITQMGTKVVTDEIRFMYPHLFTPHRTDESGKAKYSVRVVFPKTNTALAEAVKAAVKAALDAGKADKFAGKIPANLKLPLRDGDAEFPEAPEMAGMWFFNASTERSPQVVDLKGGAVADDDDGIYGGCYGRVSVNFYAFNVNGNRGVAAGLNNVQKTHDGERLGGVRTSAAEDFGIENDFL